MLLGICGGPDDAPVAKATGYDYIEINVSSHLKGEASDEETAMENMARYILDAQSSMRLDGLENMHF